MRTTTRRLGVITWATAALLWTAAGCETNGVPGVPGPGAGTPNQQTNPGGGQNAPPTLTMVWPATNITIQDGTAVLIQFSVSDPVDVVRVSLLVDVDTDTTNGNEFVLESGIEVNPPSATEQFSWDTTNFPAGTYFVRGRADDGVNPVVSRHAPGTVRILPRPGDPPGGGGGSGSPPINEVPQISLNSPTEDQSLNIGDVLTIAFTFIDRDSIKTITILADPDSIDNNGNETVIFGPEDRPQVPGAGSVSFVWDTSGFVPGRYRIVGEITDNPADANRTVRDELEVAIDLLGAGTGTPSLPPSVLVNAGVVNGTLLPAAPGFEAGAVVTIPQTDRGAKHEDRVEVRMVLRNAESEESLSVRVFLDLDRNDDNDDPDQPEGREDDPDDPNDSALDPLIPVGSFTVQGSAYNDNRFFEPLPTFDEETFFFVPFNFEVDTTVIPIRTDRDEIGRPLPYYIRIVVDDGHTTSSGERDHIVNAYASHALFVQGLAQGLVDLRDAGSTVTGATFQGIAPFDYLGTGFLPLGDIFQEFGVVDLSTNAALAADDFVMVARYGTVRSRQNVGAAYVTVGRPDTASRGRFAGVSSARSIGEEYEGSVVAGNVPTYVQEFGAASSPPEPLRDPRHPSVFWSGITSVTLVPGLVPDNPGEMNPIEFVPDLVVGVPFISGLYDAVDDDPCDCTENCVDFWRDNAIFERPLGTIGSEDNMADPADDMGFFNERDFSPIDQGYFFVISGGDLGPVEEIADDDITPAVSLLFNRINDLRWVGQQGLVSAGFASDDEGVVIGGFTPIPQGIRFRGGSFGDFFEQDDPPLDSANEFGRTVAVSPSLTGPDGQPDLLVSSPGALSERGRVILWHGFDWYSPGTAIEPSADLSQPFNHSYPNLLTPASVCQAGCMTCAITPRGIAAPFAPAFTEITGEAEGDRLGWAGPAGDFNLAGTNDIVCGAPGADKNGLSNNGCIYILFGQSVGFGNVNLQTDTFYPRIELVGTHGDNLDDEGGDRFGELQKLVGDLNGDNIADLGFASKLFDDDVTVAGQTTVDAGFVGILYGNPPATGENRFTVLQVGTANLPGVKFFGATAGSIAGASIDRAGDFNNDGYDDILIAAPGEQRLVPTVLAGGAVENQLRRGVGYLVFGGPQLQNGSFSLAQVGSPALPGVVFVSPYEAGTNDEAPVETVGGIGDIDGDGFDDIAIGAPQADLIFPPFAGSQRRESVGEAYIVYGNNLGTNQLP